MHRSRLAVVASFLGAACSSSSPSGAGSISSVSSVTSPDPTLAFQGYAHEGPNLQTGQFDIQEPQLFLTDADECDGGTSTRSIDMDIYAYALDGGAVPGSYPLTLSPGGDAAFSTFNAYGFGRSVNIVSGSVTLTAVNSSVAVGSFDAQVTAADGGVVALHGTFSAPFCDAGPGPSGF